MSNARLAYSPDGAVIGEYWEYGENHTCHSICTTGYRHELIWMSYYGEAIYRITTNWTCDRCGHRFSDVRIGTRTEDEFSEMGNLNPIKLDWRPMSY